MEQTVSEKHALRALMGLFILIIALLVSVAIKKQDIIDEKEVVETRYHSLCRGVALYLQISAECAEQGDEDCGHRIVDLSPAILNGCAVTPPIYTDHRDVCWINRDLKCLAREARALAEQLPRRE